MPTAVFDDEENDSQSENTKMDALNPDIVLYVDQVLEWAKDQIQLETTEKDVVPYVENIIEWAKTKVRSETKELEES